MIRIKSKSVQSAGSDRLESRIRDKGMRMTGARRIVADVLERAEDHLDVEEVLRRARKKDPRIHLATVYRTLNALKAAGLVDELDLMRLAR